MLRHRKEIKYSEEQLHRRSLGCEKQQQRNKLTVAFRYARFHFTSGKLKWLCCIHKCLKPWFEAQGRKKVVFLIRPNDTSGYNKFWGTQYVEYWISPLQIDGSHDKVARVYITRCLGQGSLCSRSDIFLHLSLLSFLFLQFILLSFSYSPWHYSLLLFYLVKTAFTPTWSVPEISGVWDW